jgi:hypothetical protein
VALVRREMWRRAAFLTRPQLPVSQFSSQLNNQLFESISLHTRVYIWRGGKAFFAEQKLHRQRRIVTVPCAHLQLMPHVCVTQQSER